MGMWIGIIGGILILDTAGTTIPIHLIVVVDIIRPAVIVYAEQVAMRSKFKTFDT